MEYVLCPSLHYRKCLEMTSGDRIELIEHQIDSRYFPQLCGGEMTVWFMIREHGRRSRWSVSCRAPWPAGPAVLGELLCLIILARLCTVSFYIDAYVSSVCREGVVWRQGNEVSEAARLLGK